jgi:hypothetical protein
MGRVMKSWVVAASVALLAAPAAHAAGTVIAEASGDIDGDGIPDRAQLLQANDDGDVDLAIYLSAGGKLAAKPTLVKSALGWTGTMAGQTPSLAINARGSLIASFENDSIGRDRWQTRYVLAWRKGALVVAGYSHSEHDTLNPKAGGNCDVNFLTGKGSRNSKPMTVPAHAMPLADWSDKDLPAFCNFD